MNCDVCDMDVDYYQEHEHFNQKSIFLNPQSSVSLNFSHSSFPREISSANGFLPLNTNYPGIRQLLESPPMYLVDDFLTNEECDGLISAADGFMIDSPVVGPGNGQISSSRTSSSCYFEREALPSICYKVCLLTGKPVEHLELPQVGRYLPSQFYSYHLDAFNMQTEDGRRFAQNGGQRIATVLIYLNDVMRGGSTSFPRFNVSVTPRKGMACVFFPALLSGEVDERALHAAEPAVDVKYVSQIWIRQGTYVGEPTRKFNTII